MSVSNDRIRIPLRWWSLITLLLACAVFTEAIFAGAMLSGVSWGQAAHAVSAKILIAATIIAGVIALLTRRRNPHGRKVGWIWLSLAALVFLQSALGALTAKGVNLLWIHIPLGVALFGFVACASIALLRD